MSSTKKLICVIILTIAAVLTAAAVSYAREYQITGTEWDDGETGHVYATWDECNEKTGYYVILCKSGHTYYYTSGKNKGKPKDKSGERNIKESVCKWRKVTGNRVDFGPEMSSFGNGTYYFIVLPEIMYPDPKQLPYDRITMDKQLSYYDPVYGRDTYMVISGNYSMTSDERTPLKKSVDAAAKAAVESITYAPGWVEGIKGTWMYAGPDGKLIKNQWVEDNGKKYYMGNDYLMVRGWQTIKGKFYYFGDNGALLVNTTTPDGCRVDAEGVWIQDGKQVSSTEYNKYHKSSIALKIVEDPNVRGTIKPISIPDGKDYTISSISYSIEPDKWIVGNAVKIYLTVKANQGYSFVNNVKVSCSQGTVVSNNGDTAVRNIEIKYIPKIKLQTPDVVIDENGMLRWNKVDRATKYTVKITDDDGNHSKSGPDLKYDLSDYVTGSATDGMAVKIKVTAANSSNRYIQESDPFIIEELEDYLHNHSTEGRLVQSGLNTYYMVDDNTKQTGWVQHNGFWYYFDDNKKGRAVKNAWFQDPETGKWYYFDKDGHMLVNTTTPDGYTVGPDGACL